MARLIASIQVDREGCFGALVSAEGEVRAVARAQHPPVRRWAGFEAITAEAVLEAFRAVSRTLTSHLGDGEVAAVGVCADAPTALLIGSENRFATPVLFGPGMPLPAREVPVDYREDAVLAGAYRNSPVRQIEHRQPEAALDLRRVATLGALLMHALSRQWVDCCAAPPTGAPYDPYTAGYLADDMHWMAVGMKRSSVPLLVPASGVACQVDAQATRALGWATGTPVIATSDRLACLALGLKAGPAAWVVELGDGLQTAWIGPRPLGSKQLQAAFVDPEPAEAPETLQGAPDSQATDTPPALDASELSHAAWDAFAGCGELRPGARHETSTLRRRSAGGLLDCDGLRAWRDAPEPAATRLAEAAPVSEAALAAVPLGTDGLRYVPGRHSGVLLGLRAGHDQAHVLRAVLEGLALELGHWRRQTRTAGLDRLRLVVRHPWALDVAHLVADIVGEELIAWGDAPELPVVIGQALAIARDLALGDPNASPTLSLTLVAPGERSAAYAQHRALHALLKEQLAAVLG